MPLWDRIFGKIKPGQHSEIPLLTAIGLTEAICPHCDVALPKMPGRKIICKSCGGAIHVRKRPIDDIRVLVKPEQLPELEEQWAVRNGTYELLRKDREELDGIRDDLRGQFGQEPSHNDVLWRLYNNRIEQYASKFWWGLYRNNHLDMARVVLSEKRYKHVLHHLCVVMLFDANGPLNGGTDEHGNPLSTPERCWDLKLAFFSRSVINMVLDAMMKGEFSIDELEAIFFEVSEPYVAGYGMPLSSKQAWAIVKYELEA